MRRLLAEMARPQEDDVNGGGDQGGGSAIAASAGSALPLAPSKSSFSKPREYDDAAKSEIGAIASLWGGDDTSGSDYDAIRVKLTLWQNESFGFNGMFYPQNLQLQVSGF